MANQVNKYGKPYKIADKAFLLKQKDLLRLFRCILQSNYYKDQAEIAHTYKIEEHLDQYTHQEYVKEFINYYREGLLPRGEVFSIFYGEHRQQAIALFHVFYYAKDWETFYKTACWARDHVNEGMFVYTIHVAVLHRKDTQGFVLPPIYEIYPHYFVDSDAMDKAFEYKMKFSENCKKTEDTKHVITSLYSRCYYREDVGFNAYYYYFNLDYPFWMGGEEYGLYKDRRGELYYYIHQQLLAHYNLARLSSDRGSIQAVDWKGPLPIGHVPPIRYPNGITFPTRTAKAYFNGEKNHFKIQQIEDYERRIRDAIDSGFIFTEDGKKINLYEENGFDYLGRIVAASPDSPNSRFYGYLQVIAHEVLGYSDQPGHHYKIYPSVMEHFETALRDPVFYEFYKRIIFYFLQYKNHLSPYTYTQLNFPGVKIENMQVDKLVSFFDKFDFELTNALYFTEEEFEKDNFQVWLSQHRLNHKPFTYKINVESNKTQDVVFRVFIGPKYDHEGHEIPLKKNRINFMELDQFVYTLQPGKNIVIRDSEHAKYAQDNTSYRQLYQNVLSALQGKGEFHLDMTEAHNYFPTRYMLPRGQVGGQVFQFYVYVSPYTQKKQQCSFDEVMSAGVGSGERYYDELPFGYPFDRPIKDEHTFYVPNSYIEDVVIYLKTENPLNPHSSPYRF